MGGNSQYLLFNFKRNKNEKIYIIDKHKINIICLN